MVRVKRGVAAKKKKRKLLKATKGYRGLNSKNIKMAHQTWMKAGINSYRDRRLKKRNFRNLWIARISAALGMIKGAPGYSRFIDAANKKGVELNRKVLADLALNHPTAFEKVVEAVK